MKFSYLFLTPAIFLLMLSCKDTANKENTLNISEKSDSVTDSILVTLEQKWDAQLGEGAFWNHRTQELFWVDILDKKLYLYHPETGKTRSYEMPSSIGTVVPQTDSTAVVALEDGIYIQHLLNRNLTLLSDIEADMPGNRFNDGKADPNGNLWVGSMQYKQNDPVARLYKVSPAGEATEMLDSITISNGIVWTKDAKTLYYIDTPTGVIRAFDYDMETASISNERIAVKVPDSLGYPDGMTIDSEDKLWVGMWNGNAVIRFDPVNGKVIQRIEAPAHNVTSCAFGGPNLDILYITTASVDMTEEEKEQFPLAGSLFAVKPGVKGVPSATFGIQEQ